MKGTVYTSQSYCFQPVCRLRWGPTSGSGFQPFHCSGEAGIIICVWGEQGWRWLGQRGGVATNQAGPPAQSCHGLCQPLGTPLPGHSTATPAGQEGKGRALPSGCSRTSPSFGQGEQQQQPALGSPGEPPDPELLLRSGSQHGSARWRIWNKICGIRVRNQ